MVYEILQIHRPYPARFGNDYRADFALLHQPVGKRSADIQHLGYFRSPQQLAFDTYMICILIHLKPSFL
jgi:hypothetical protein